MTMTKMTMTKMTMIKTVERPKASVSPLYLLLSFSGLVCFLVVVSTFMFYGFLIAFLPTFLKKLVSDWFDSSNY